MTRAVFTKQLALIVLGTSFFASAQAACDAHLSADKLLEQVRRDGAKPVLFSVADNEACFGYVLAKMETGKPKWLRLASQLRGAADGGVSLSLDYSVARAIPHNPRGVLSSINHGFTISGVCTSPFIEPEPGVAERYEKLALRALQGVKGSLSGIASECAAMVKLPEKP